MFFDYRLIGSTAMFSGCGGGKMPFDVGCAADKRDIVEIDYLESVSLGPWRIGTDGWL